MVWASTNEESSKRPGNSKHQFLKSVSGFVVLGIYIASETDFGAWDLELNLVAHHKFLC